MRKERLLHHGYIQPYILELARGIEKRGSRKEESTKHKKKRVSSSSFIFKNISQQGTATGGRFW